MTVVNDLLDQVEVQEERQRRFYLGISGIGNSNNRLVWMRYRWLMPDDWEPRVLRLLDLGNVVEEDLIKKLRKIPGAKIYDVDKNGKQFKTKAFDSIAEIVVQKQGQYENVIGIRNKKNERIKL